MFKKKELIDDSFIIAEVGQNHQGDLDIALEYIEKFASTGLDAVKFQTRNNKYLFSESAYEKKYNSENAFAEKYGEHREKLELDPAVLPTLKQKCKEHGLKFMSTPFDEPSLEILCENDIDILKVASFDLGNLPLIEKIAKTGIPTVISIGGGKIDQIRSSIELLTEYLDEVAVLHCVSEYPTDVNRLGLSNIRMLIDEFPSCTIGLSDHFSGILSGPIAYTEGARVFEKHVTMNHAWKGTDHSFALEFDGMRKFVRDIKRVPMMFNSKPEDEIGDEQVFQKLGKSLIISRDIKKGETLNADNLSGRIFESQYIPVRESNRVIGKTVKKDMKKDDILEYDSVDL